MSQTVLIIGVFISGLILVLLTSADAYFDKFLSSIVTNINVDFNLWYVIKGIIYFCEMQKNIIFKAYT